jgi:diguanylate cyclase (GGDEF)-like protein
MNALARNFEKKLHSARAPELRSDPSLSTWPLIQSSAAVNLLTPESTHSESVSPKVAQAIAAMRGEVRSTFIFLQVLVLGVMVGSAVLNFNILHEQSVWLPFMALLAIFGGLLFLPVRMIAADWFPGLLAILDTIITATLFYYSGRAGAEAYAAYFLIMIIALLTRTKHQTILYTLVVTTMYGLAFYQDTGWAGITLDYHLLQLPLTLAVAVACGRTMESVRILTTSDPVTGLPTRTQFVALLSRAVKQARKSREKISVLVLEIAGIDQIYETKGHSASDRVMKHIVNRLVPLLKPGDVVARHGQATLAILTRNYATSAEVVHLAHESIDMLRVPLIELGERVSLAAHIGVELVPDAHKLDVSAIIDNAKSALICAKTRGKNSYEFYSEDMASRAYDPQFLEMSLREALDRRELSVAYQPKINLETGQLVGTEALMRWHHPDLGPVSPVHFIPLAEEFGLIETLGEWILRSACLQGIGWQESGYPHILIGVNVSPKQLRNPQLVSTVSRILKETNLNPKCLELEVTESVLIVEADAALENLCKLKSLGVHLSVDDFGTGYSGLSYLTQLPVDALKIDQHFVREISNGHQAKAIIKGVVDMALSMGLKVTAEGVESQEQALFLRDIGCHEGQGFFYSKPLSSGNMEQYLQGEQQRQMVEAGKNALIDALSSRDEKKDSPVRRAL